MSNMPDLEPRFLAPANWQTDYFNNEDTGHNLHYGWAKPENGAPKGVVILLQGLQESTEKFYETARFFIAEGFGIVLFDWQYQGRSARHLDNFHKRHSDGFDTDVDDLKRLIEEEIKYIFPDIPLHFLSHSTGGNIALRYLITYPNDIKSASFSAPLMGIYGLSRFPDFLILTLLKFLNLAPNAYVPGGSDWREDDRPSDGTGKFSSDPARDAIANKLYLFDESLQGGSPTNAWLRAAYRSMMYLKNSGALKQIKTPCYFGLAENDIIVCTKTALKVLPQIPNAQIDVLPNAKHEILMETDDIRGQFLNNALHLTNSAA